MAINVPYLSPTEIEYAAIMLLIGFGDVRNGGKIKPPVAVEKILEKHLKLTLDFDDLHERLGLPKDGDEPEVLGALWTDTGEIFIDQSLDPDEHPEREGRYRLPYLTSLVIGAFTKTTWPRQRDKSVTCSATAGPRWSLVIQVSRRPASSCKRIGLRRAY
jgi:hypothetical protein